MKYYNTYHLQHTEELNALPNPYPIEMAINNDDIVVNRSDPYNTERFFEFLSNAREGIPDKVRITRYGIDNPELALKSILEYNGEIFIYTQSSDFSAPVSYYGNNINVRYRQPNGPWQYYLLTYDGGEELLFSLYKYHTR